MILRTVFLFLSMLFFSTALQAFSEEFPLDFYSAEEAIEPSTGLEKIYVEPSQLYIVPEGIFFLNREGMFEQAYAVFNDHRGVYVFSTRIQYYQCPACGRWNRDNLCWNQNCPLFGK